MKDFFLGQKFVDFNQRQFIVTDLYSSDRDWDDSRITKIFEIQTGNIHVQGNLNDADIRMIGFYGDNNEHKRLSVEKAKSFIKRNLLNFEQ